MYREPYTAEDAMEVVGYSAARQRYFGRIVTGYFHGPEATLSAVEVKLGARILRRRFRNWTVPDRGERRLSGYRRFL